MSKYIMKAELPDFIKVGAKVKLDNGKEGVIDRLAMTHSTEGEPFEFVSVKTEDGMTTMTADHAAKTLKPNE